VSILCVLQVVKLKKKCKGKHSTDSTYSHRYTSVLIFCTDALSLKNLHSLHGHAFLQLYRSMAAFLISFGHEFLECLLTEHMIKCNWLRAKSKGCLFTISNKKMSAKDGEKLCASSQYTCIRIQSLKTSLSGLLSLKLGL
jgi:hypothetical protein